MYKDEDVERPNGLLEWVRSLRVAHRRLNFGHYFTGTQYKNEDVDKLAELLDERFREVTK